MPDLNSLVLSLAFVAWITNSVPAEPPPARWPQFRGPDCAGIAQENWKYPGEFGPDNLLLWSTPLPPGHSSPCIWGDRIFISGSEPGSKKLETICVDRKSGRVIWRKTVPADKSEPIHELNNPAASTPATDGERVYSYFGMFGLACYDRDGNEVWRRPFAPIPGRFGSGQSPAVAGDFVLLNTGSGNFSYTLSAFDRKTGKTAWEKNRPRGFSQSLTATPTVRVVPDGYEVLAVGGQRIGGYNLADGAERWHMTGLSAVSLNTPVIVDGYAIFTLSNPVGDSENVVSIPTFDEALKKYDANDDGKIQFAEIPKDVTFFTRGRQDKVGDWAPLRDGMRRHDRDKDGALDRDEWKGLIDDYERAVKSAVTTTYCLRLDAASGEQADRVAWTQAKSAPEVPSPLVYQGRVYLVSERGFITCRDFQSGRELYRERLGVRGICYSSPVAGDGVVIACSDGGTVVVLKAGDKFEALSKVQFNEPILATPALVDGKIYLRTVQRLMAFGR